VSITRSERGWAGHFICANSCRFRRNTLVSDGDRHIVVSTVGAYFSPLDEEKPSTIGWERDYETMAFRAKPDDSTYHDADVSRQVALDSNWTLKITPKNEDRIDNLADEMHEGVVAEVMADFEKAWDSAAPAGGPDER
jgi:hypothetical protein